MPFDHSSNDPGDLSLLAAGIGGQGVIYGGEVTAHSPASMLLAVAFGYDLVSGALKTITAGDVTVPLANDVLPRWDLVVADTAGALSVFPGLPAADPVYPTLPSGHVVHAAVYVAPGATSIGTDAIVDKRLDQRSSIFTAVRKDTSRGTLSTSYNDLNVAELGPGLLGDPNTGATGLPNGVYVFLWGAYAKIGTAGETAFMNLAVPGDGTTPPDAYAARTQTSNSVSIVGFRVATLTASDDNPCICYYKTSNGAVTATFASRWLMALRIGV